MRGLIGFAAGIALAGFMALACGGTPAQNKPLHSKHPVAMMRTGFRTAAASATCTNCTASSLSMQATTLISKPDGSVVITVDYSTGGAGLFSRNLVITPDGKRVLDDKGAVLMAPAPPAVQKTRDAYAGEVEKMVTTLASSGKAAP